ncbi:hypothetical protein BU17DRAFT_55298 [Hysterangium stoloniferum]|nr:hypothetical protein BU17DRAFT_55298 [Hysterangium stoloniferum]
MASTALHSSGSSPASTSVCQTLVNGEGESSQHSRREEPQQAEPLPRKVARLVGEIGYSAETQELDVADADPNEGLNAAEADARNGRHPADTSNLHLPQRTDASLPGSSNPNNSTTTLNTTTTPAKRIFFIRTSPVWSKQCGGISVKTMIRFTIVIVILGGSIIGWVFGDRAFSRADVSQNRKISPILMHLFFSILVLILLITLERCIFRMRVERYVYLHPGQVLPSHRRRARAANELDPSRMALAPWNRPPLPTYAAALGVRGTGDVEDNIIAAPPPPAYGNTRGSTLLLATFLRNSVNGARSHLSVQSRQSQSNMRRSGASVRSLPVSYDESEHHSDVERARILEETLAKLEDNR